MSVDPVKIPTSGVGLSAAATLLLLGFVTVTTQGQTHPLPPPDTSNAERIRLQQMSQREWELRNLGHEPAKQASEAKRTHAIVDQVEQDFKRILTLHNEFARILSGSAPLDYLSVSEAAGEIKKRASRLQNHLALPKPDADEQKEELALNEKQIRAVLVKLCRHIESFVDNPIIATPGALDAKQLERARTDLEEVVEISDNVKKSVDKLKKTAQ